MSESVPSAPTDPETRPLATAAGTITFSEEGPGAAPAVVCAHGIPGSARDFRYLAPLLARRLRVVRLEMPGFGDAPPAKDATVTAWGALQIEAARTLGLERFLLLGHSFGGGAVLQAARLAGEELAGIVLLASMGTRRHRAFALSAAAYRRGGRLLRIAALRPLLMPALRAGYRAAGLQPPDAADWRTVALHMALLGSVDFDDQAAVARSLRVPALLFQARDDGVVEPPIAREMAALVPRARLVEFDSGRHHLNKSRAAEVAAEVVAFAEEIGLLPRGR